MNILFTIIILGLIIFLHELGHFLTAKYYKMPVLEFAIGMGPKLITRKIGETDYSLRVLPLGGFVNIGGMQPEENKENEVVNGFYTKPAFSRFVVLVAGVVMNFLTAIMGVFLLLSVVGTVPPRYIEPVVESVQENVKASGVLMPDDRIIEIGDMKISSWNDVSEKIALINTSEKKYEGEKIPVKVIREGKEVTEKVELTYSQEREGYLLGIKVRQEKLSLMKKIRISFYSFGDYFKIMLSGLKMLLTGKASLNQMTGPVGLPKFVGEAYRSGGMAGLINIFVLLSINIGLMNLLPIPALDGGRLLFVIPEFVGVKVNKKIEERIHMVGMVLLLGLMAFVVFNDIVKYF